MQPLADRMVMKFRDVLRETERFGQGELKSYQWQLLEPLVRHAHQNVPFYRERLAPLIHGDEIRLENWQQVPIMTRAEAQQHARSLHAASLPPHAGKVSSEITSGSTGRPLDHLTNELLTIASLSFTDRVYRWWNIDGNRIMANFTSRRRELAPPPEGRTSREWRSGFPNGIVHVIDMWADTQIQIDWLAKRKPAYLATYSSILLPLAQGVARRGCELRFDKILSMGSMVTDDIRKSCKDVFGAPVIDQYGAQEVGHIATQCPRCGHYHISSENVLVEILDEHDQPCEPGETGRVVITSFYNYAMPFIRYEIGDYATLGPSEARCQITLPTLSRIAGRYRDTFTLADGRIIYPYVAIDRFRDYIPFRQVQVVQTDYDRIEVRYVRESEQGAPDEKGLESYIQEAIDPSFEVHLVETDAIPRHPSGKFEDFKSEVSKRN